MASPNAMVRHVARSLSDLRADQIARFKVEAQDGGELNFIVTVNSGGSLRYSLTHVMSDGQYAAKDALFVAFKDDFWWLQLLLEVHKACGPRPVVSIRGGTGSSGSFPPIAA